MSLVSEMVKLQDDADLKLDDEIMLEPIPLDDVKSLIVGCLPSNITTAISLVEHFYSLCSNLFVNGQVPLEHLPTCIFHFQHQLCRYNR